MEELKPEDKNWFKHWFNSPFYTDVYSHRNNVDARKTVDFIIDKLKLNKDQFILDAACGIGRHSNLLGAYGYNVISFDLSLNLLKMAKKNCSANSNVKFINSDIRDTYFKINFDLVLNLFTSFGYFDSDEENFRFFKNIYCNLKDTGLLLFDYLNPNYLFRNLTVNSKRNIKDISVEEYRYFENGRINKNIKLAFGDKEFKYHESVKLYSFDELISNFSRIGFKLSNSFGSYQFDKFEESESERIILLLKK